MQKVSVDAGNNFKKCFEGLVSWHTIVSCVIQHLIFEIQIQFFSVSSMPKNCCLISYRADPLSNMVLTFSTKEDAIAFAEKNGMYCVYGL